MRLRSVSAVLVVLAAGLAAWADGPGQDRVGAKVDFELKSILGETVRLSADDKAKAFVVVFVGTECPINNLYLGRLNELHEEFAPRGVRFLAVNANVQDSPERILRHAQEHKVAFPVLRDQNNLVADRFGAKKTPEAFVLDAGRVIRYTGRIDDCFGIDVQRAAPTRQDLAEALREVLAGKRVSVPSTRVDGCYIGRAPEPKAEASVTFTRDVAPVLQKNCQECHRPGQIGPMALIKYEDVAAWGETVRYVVEDGRMPPWHADPAHGKFANDRRLSAADRRTLLAWVEQGMPRGDDADMPPPREFPAGWRIGTPDLVIEMPEAFDVPARMPKFGIPYQYFFLDPGFKEDVWVERAEAQAGAPEVVHHVLAFLVPPGQRFFPGNPKTPVLAGTAPGDLPLVLKPGMAKRIPAGSKIVFQMHYTPNGRAATDRSRIGLIFAKEKPTKEVVTVPIFNLAFRIPAGADDYEVQARYPIRKDAYIINMAPHMHLRGKDFAYLVRTPDGRERTVLSVPRYNFNWQTVYRLAEPVFVPAGSEIRCVAHYDNSGGNPNNPDPTVPVAWGDQTWEEMMVGWIDIAYDLGDHGGNEKEPAKR